jgi:hypothetical protein
VFELWVDGKLEAARTDLDWHGEWTDYGINAVFLENFWNQGSVKKQVRWFDDFVISTKPIGPILALKPATVVRAEPGAIVQVEALPIQWRRHRLRLIQLMPAIEPSSDQAHGALPAAP